MSLTRRCCRYWTPPRARCSGGAGRRAGTRCCGTPSSRARVGRVVKGCLGCVGCFVCQTRLKLSWKVNECKPLQGGQGMGAPG